MGNSSVISPIKIGGKIIGGQNGSLVRIGGQPHPSQPQNILPELRRRHVREPRHAVNRRRVHALVAPRAAHVSLEHLEPVIVLILRRIRLPEPPLENREVVLRSQQPRVTVAAVDHFPDQRIFGGGFRRDGWDEEKSEEKGENECSFHSENASEENNGFSVGSFSLYIYIYKIINKAENKAQRKLQRWSEGQEWNCGAVKGTVVMRRSWYKYP